MIKPLQNSQIIDIVLTAGTRSYDLTYQDILIGKKVTGIVVSPAGGKTLDGASIADASNAYLYLRNQQNEEFFEFPCRNLVYNGGTPLLQALPLNLDGIEWKKSKLRFEAGASLTTGEAFQMTVFYEE